MTSSIKLGGHRGRGCTDHEFYQSVRDIPNLPVENTLESIADAFAKGADYIETDAVISGDGVVFSLHNVVPKDHYFGETLPSGLLNTLPFSEIESLSTGRCQNGKITRFSEILACVAKADPKTLPWAMNIEIKGVQGSGQNYEANDYLTKLAETVKNSSLDTTRILWSSLSAWRMCYAYPICSLNRISACCLRKKRKADPFMPIIRMISAIAVCPLKRITSIWCRPHGVSTLIPKQSWAMFIPKSHDHHRKQD